MFTVMMQGLDSAKFAPNSAKFSSSILKASGPGAKFYAPNHYFGQHQAGFPKAFTDKYRPGYTASSQIVADSPATLLAMLKTVATSSSGIWAPSAYGMTRPAYPEDGAIWVAQVPGSAVATPVIKSADPTGSAGAKITVSPAPKTTCSCYLVRFAPRSSPVATKIFSSGSSPIALGGLGAGTAYTVSVACKSSVTGEYSDWSKAVDFATAPAAPTKCDEPLVLVDGACKPCPVGTEFNGGKCVACSAEACTAFEPLPGRCICSECAAPKFLAPDAKCMGCVAPTVYDHPSKSCKACTKPDVISGGVCAPCKTGTHYTPDGDSARCVPCSEDCLECTSHTECSVCRGPYVVTDGMCQPCSGETVYDPVTKSCKTCDSPTVFDAPSKSCKACDVPMIPVDGKCTTCPVGTDYAGGKCITCEPPMIFADGECKPCAAPAIFVDGKCSECPENTQFVDGKCQPCSGEFCTAYAPLPSRCACSACKPDYKPIDGKCIECSLAPADVYFLADSTGSMGSAISAVKTGINDIMTSIRATTTGTVRFGAGDYKDVSDSYAFKNGASLESPDAVVKAAVNAWSAGGGGDLPEAQLYALSQLADPSNPAGFKDGSSKFVVWFGDAPGHVRFCKGAASYITEDISIDSVTADLHKAGIQVIAISVGSNQLDSDYAGTVTSTGGTCDPSTPNVAVKQATKIAAETGGLFVSGITPSNIVKTITDAVKKASECPAFSTPPSLLRARVSSVPTGLLPPSDTPTPN